MKNKKSKSINKKVFVSLTALAFSFGAVPLNYGTFSYDKTYAYIPTEITVDNGDFSATSTSSYPRTASNWTKSSDSSTSSAIKAGVISTVLETFKEEYKSYGLAIENTSDLENSDNLNVYMINSGDKSIRYGIKSNSISLDAGSYYKVTADVKTSLPVLVGDNTLNLSSMASIYLNVGDESYKFIGIDTYNGWDTYTFYVHTNKFVAPTIDVELWLGSKQEIQSSGAVLFDNIKVTKLASENWYATNDATNKIVELDNKAEYDATDKINNASFEDISDIWEVETNEKNQASGVTTGICNLISYDIKETHIPESPNTNGNKDNNFALFINNESKAGVTYKSNTFTIEKYTNYLIQVYVKTGEFEEGGATISLVPTNEDLKATTFSSVVTSKTTNSITNNWTQYSFYVQGSPFADEEVYLALGVGSVEEDDLVKGYAFFDDISISKITYNDYESASTSSNTVKKAQLHSITSSSEITNAYFNLVDSAFTGTYPLAPSGWTASNSENSTSGIISTRKDDFESKTETYYGNLPWFCVGLTPLQTNVDENTADNNLLMIYNPTYSYQSYSSSSYSMSASSYYKISVDARTLTTDKAFIKVKVDGNTVATYSFRSEDEWSTFETYFATGFGAKNVSVELGLGKENDLANGYAFFDNVMVKSLTADEFTTAKKVETNKIIDYTVEDFSIVTGESDEDLQIPSHWSTSTNDKSKIGIDTSESENALKIGTTDNNTSLKSESSITYTLDKETYYIATFKIKTSAFADLEKSGATFGFKEVDKNRFEYIVNNGEEYAEYKFYINGAEYSSLTPYFQLDIKDGINGEFIKLQSISFEAITESKFSEKLKEVENDDTITDVVFLGNVTEDEEDDHDHDTEYVAGTFDWYLIPTIITTLALILAVIGVLLQKRKKKAKKVEKQKKFANKYDREITLHKALIEKEAQAIRKQKLEELKLKLQTTDDELEQIESDYKERIKDSNANQQAEFKKYAKTRKKVAERKEKLEEEKKYVQSDEFMQEATNKVLETYEPESHEKEVEQLAKEQENSEVEGAQSEENESLSNASDEVESQDNDETVENGEDKNNK
ncbi:MAG: hypothetical protein ACI4TX_03205 [Christensenellales bacterium]